MNRKPVTRALAQSFIWSFIISVGCFVGMVVIGATTSRQPGITPAEGLLLLLMVAAGLGWYITLGMIASRLGRRWLVWTGVSFITAPIGPLVVFPLMLGHIKAAGASSAETVGGAS